MPREVVIGTACALTVVSATLVPKFYLELPSKARKILVCEAGGRIITASPHISSLPSGKEKWPSPKRDSNFNCQVTGRTARAATGTALFGSSETKSSQPIALLLRKKHILKGIQLSNSNRLNRICI